MGSQTAAAEFFEAPTSLPYPRLLPHVVRDIARAQPEKIWGSLPLDRQSAKLGYENITYRRFAYAVDRAAVWIKENLEPQRLGPFEHLAYPGIPDSRYQMFTLAAIKAGFRMLFLSPRNTNVAQYGLADQAHCYKWLCSTEFQDRVQALIASRPKAGTGASTDIFMTVPDQQELLKDDPVPEFPYDKTVNEARSEPFVTLHTSSTTGLPKLMPLLHGHGFNADLVRYYLAFKGLEVLTRKIFNGHCRLYLGMPLFHGGGVALGIWTALYQDVIIVFQPPDAPVNATVINDVLRHGECTGAVLRPFLVEEMIKVPEYFDTLAWLKFVQFGSGPMSKYTGDLLLTRQKSPAHFIGGSEYGVMPVLELEDPTNEWQYFHFHPWAGAEMRPYAGDDDIFELFIKKLDTNVPGLQHPFETTPSLDALGTKDLFRQHPEKPYLWRVAGRADDILVLSNGLKINPVDMESLIANANPAISGALVVGHGRFQPALLLEVEGVTIDSEVEREKFIGEIWPLVEAANKIAPKYGQLTKALLLFSSLDRPFQRTPKLSVRRKATADLYAAEIEILYIQAENDVNKFDSNDLLDHFDLDSRDSSQNFVQELVQKVTGWRAIPKLDSDFFTMGMDSLHVVRITRALKAALGDSISKDVQKGINMGTVYARPTTEHLSSMLYDLLQSPTSNGARNPVTNGTIESVSREQKLDNVVERWTQNLKSPSEKTEHSGANGTINGANAWTIILTGSTGTLGKYLLETLALDPRVSKVICLNRAADAAENWEKRRISRKLSDQANNRIQFLNTTNFGAPFLGLNEEVYRGLRDTVTHAIHNAWPVNFNMSLASFENNHIGGVRNLVGFCSESTKAAKLFFVSRVGSVALGGLKTTVPEKIIYNYALPSRSGYAEAKYISELVVDTASKISNGRISTVVLRVGQIAGPVGPEAGTDVWNINEWFPSILRSSKTLGVLPSSLGRFERVDWLPVNSMAQVIVELIESMEFRRPRAGSVVYHVINPAAVTWNKSVLPIFKEQLGIEKTVSLKEWVDLVAAGPGPEDTKNPNPAIKILQFYRGLDSVDDHLEPIVRTDVTEHDSNTLRELGPVREDWIRKWAADLGN